MTEYEYRFYDMTVSTDWNTFFDVRLDGKLISEVVGDCRPDAVVLGGSWPNDDALEVAARENARHAIRAWGKNQEMES